MELVLAVIAIIIVPTVANIIFKNRPTKLEELVMERGRAKEMLVIGKSDYVLNDATTIAQQETVREWTLDTNVHTITHDYYTKGLSVEILENIRTPVLLS